MSARQVILLKFFTHVRGSWESYRPVRTRSGTRDYSLVTAFAVSLLASASSVSFAEEDLFVSKRVAPINEYTKGIEGPAADTSGNLFVVNFQEQGTIGILEPNAIRSKMFAKLPQGSVGNGIRFDINGQMYVADYKLHKVFVFRKGERTPELYFQSKNFHQPNDLAMAKDGTIYASDPNFALNTGRIWRLVRGPDGRVSGEPMSGARKMGTANGLDLSSDERSLYVSESNTGEVWAYQLRDTKLDAPRLVKRFGGELDGLRTDAEGRIFVTRPSNGTIAVLTPDGEIVREIKLRGSTPSNLTFGGADHRTVFVTEVSGRCIEAFRSDQPGREPFQPNIANGP